MRQICCALTTAGLTDVSCLNVKPAADRIKSRNYPQVLEHYAWNILIVSVNYDKDAGGDGFKKHSCRIHNIFIKNDKIYDPFLYNHKSL